MDFSRADRLQSQLVKEIVAVVENELHDRPPAMITFTRAEITRDLRYARVYYSALGSENAVASCKEYLERHNGVIRRLVGQRIRVRYIPELTFIYDRSAEHVMRINEILEQLKKDEDKS